MKAVISSSVRNSRNPIHVASSTAWMRLSPGSADTKFLGNYIRYDGGSLPDHSLQYTKPVLLGEVAERTSIEDK